jgi:hypothetical protein
VKSFACLSLRVAIVSFSSQRPPNILDDATSRP